LNLDSVIVTGCSGFIGKNLVKFLKAKGVNTTGLARSDVDLLDQSAVKLHLAKLKPDLIFHLASVSVGQGNEPWSSAADEVRMLSHLSLGMPPHCRLVYTGSMAEYGHAGTLHELDPCYPNTGYGFAKNAAVNFALATRANLSLDIGVARLFGVYGPGESPKRLLPMLIAKLAAGETVDLSDGEQVRDFVHVDDVCLALEAMGQHLASAWPLVNVGTGVGVKVKAVCETVASVLGADPGLLRFGAIARRTVDEDCLVAKTERLATFASVPVQRWLSHDSAAETVQLMQSAAAAV
jgi:nucleoside-diphosphate-sugar epimerase